MLYQDCTCSFHVFNPLSATSHSLNTHKQITRMAEQVAMVVIRAEQVAMVVIRAEQVAMAVIRAEQAAMVVIRAEQVAMVVIRVGTGGHGGHQAERWPWWRHQAERWPAAIRAEDMGMDTVIRAKDMGMDTVIMVRMATIIMVGADITGGIIITADGHIETVPL